MRVNVYSQEITNEVLLVHKKSNTGVIYSAIQFLRDSSHMLHHPPLDDDRSAVTFWLPNSQDRREALAKAFEQAAFTIRSAPMEQAATNTKVATKQPVVPEWAGSEDFGGSDQDSHYMNSKEGLAALTKVANANVLSYQLPEWPPGGLFISNYVANIPARNNAVGDVWKLLEVGDTGMVTLGNTTTKAQIIIQQIYLHSAYHYLGEMSSFKIGDHYLIKGNWYKITNLSEEIGSVYLEPLNSTGGFTGGWHRIDKF